jgi:hypothetical protein
MLETTPFTNGGFLQPSAEGNANAAPAFHVGQSSTKL